MVKDEDVFWVIVDVYCLYINIGIGSDCLIKELVEMIKISIGY